MIIYIINDINMVYVYRVDPSEMPYTFCPFNPPDSPYNCSNQSFTTIIQFVFYLHA